MRVQYLKEAEPYQVGDVVEVADDRVEYLLSEGIVKKVDGETPLTTKSQEKEEEPEPETKAKTLVENKAVKKQKNS